jgi:hypothetical protein
MGATKDVVIRMKEEEYSIIPNEFKERYFNSKNVSIETNDWAENMKDEMYSSLYKQKKYIQKQLEEREYQLRENRRKNS